MFDLQFCCIIKISSCLLHFSLCCVMKCNNSHTMSLYALQWTRVNWAFAALLWMICVVLSSTHGADLALVSQLSYLWRHWVSDCVISATQTALIFFFCPSEFSSSLRGQLELSLHSSALHHCVKLLTSQQVNTLHQDSSLLENSFQRRNHMFTFF